MDIYEGKAAEQALDKIWRNVGQSVFKLAMLQDNLGQLPTEWTAPWRQGDYQQAITAMGADRAKSAFHTMTLAKKVQGVTIHRVQIVDTENLTPSIQISLEVLAEYWRRGNVTYGGEEVFMLSKTACIDNGIALPETDAALFDRRHVVVTHYGSTTITSRDIYRSDNPDDISYIEHTTETAQQIASLLPLAHKLDPIFGNDRTVWAETIGLQALHMHNE